MGFITVEGIKLGKMRKPQDWVVYPSDEIAKGLVTIQCDNRIAQVNLNEGEAILSDGKGGHQGHIKLHPSLGATVVEVDAETLGKIKAAVEGRNDYRGEIVLVGR